MKLSNQQRKGLDMLYHYGDGTSSETLKVSISTMKSLEKRGLAKCQNPDNEMSLEVPSYYCTWEITDKGLEVLKEIQSQGDY